MIPSRFAHWNTSWKSLAFASILLFLVMALACEPPVTPENEPPNPSGDGWLVWKNSSFQAKLTNFTVQRNTISFNIVGGYHIGCVPQTAFTYTLSNNIFIVKTFYKLPDPMQVCTQEGRPFTLQVSLPATSGTYRVYLRPTPISRAFDTTVTVP